MSGYLYDCCGSTYGLFDEDFAHERIEMMIIDLYDKFGDRFGYYSGPLYTVGPKINIMYSPLYTKCRTFYLEKEIPGYTYTEPKNIITPIYDQDGHQIGVFYRDQEYGEYEIRVKVPAICNGHPCVFKEQMVPNHLYKDAISTLTRAIKAAHAVLNNDPYKISNSMLTPTTKVDRIVFNDPATIVFWKDGTKTIVKCSDNEDFNPYFGFCAAVAKRVFGNNSQVRKMVESGYFQDTNDGKVKQKTITKNTSNKKSKKEKSKNG